LINQQKGALAQRHLSEIQRRVEDCAIPLLSAEHQLTFAEALAATKNPAAEAEFEDALRQIRNLPECDPILELRALEHFARCLRSQRKFSRALELYASAKKIAVESRLLEDSARVQLLHMTVTFEIDNEPQLHDFRSLKQAAKDGDFTAQEQLEIWLQYTGDSGTNEGGLLAARKRGSVEYFERLLKALREEQRDEIPG
jgi:hypothetical protein